jgi:hypothetical protein
VGDAEDRKEVYLAPQKAQLEKEQASEMIQIKE